ncbi:hypothetical protein [Knoellia sp. LjRoot47]|uniref:hypothetical protein n=1 Tax=Knoellia sp. LjRoot47 TaxID=3342330 RepID=UPI003ECE77B1
MGVVEFELARIVHAPVADVFARLADIDGHNTWMPQRGSILHHTEKTSPGPPGLGTTYLDQQLFGWTPGEISEFDPPTLLVYHWWDKTRRGKVTVEGWPGYRLEAKGDHTTLVHHTARLVTYGAYRVATPVLHWIAVRERTATLDALETSFGHHHH